MGDALAFRCFSLMQHMSWEVIKDLHGMELTARGAEELLVRLDWLQRWQQERMQRQEMPGQSAIHGV